MEEADPNNNNGGGRDPSVSEHRAKIVHLERKLLQEKDRYDLLQSESDFAKLSATQEVEKYRRECCCLRESVARLNEDCSMLREREAKDRETIKSLLEEMEAKEREFREKLVELKVEIRCLESGKRRAKDEVREWMEKYGEVEAWVLRLFDENRLLKEKGTAATKNVEGTRKVKVEEENFCPVEKGKRVESAGKIDEEMPKRKHGAVVVDADNRGERGSSESDVDEGRVPLRKKRCVEVSKGAKMDSDSSKECSVPLQQHQNSGAKGTSVKVVNTQVPLVQANVQEEVDAATETLSLHIQRGVSQESESIDESDSKEEEVRPINGGPIDLSLLKSFRTHVAFFISKSEERDPLRCINHMRKINTWSLESGQPNTRFVQHIRNSSLYPLIICSYQYISSVELSAFVERWHPETNTFHLPFGEMTISLDDVACLIGLPITGKSVSLPDRTDELIAVEQLTNSLGVGDNEAFAELNTKGGVSVRLDWLRERFSDVTDADSDQRILCAARAYLLYLLGCTLFADKSGTRVSVDYLALLHDVENVHTYAWGAGALVYLYRQLGIASRAHSAQLSGYLTLLQAWIFTHFPSLMPILNGGYRPYQPQACRWLSRRDSKVSLDHVRTIRKRIDTLTANEVTWDPYRSFRDTHQFQEVCFYMGTLKMKDIVEPYHPVRVLRQFGRRQYIPPPPFRPIREKRGLTSKSYLVTHAHIKEMWLSWLDHMLSQEHRGVEASYPGECTHDYMAWFANVSRCFIGPSTQASNRAGAQNVLQANTEKRIREAIAIIDAFLEQGETASKKCPDLLFNALVKIKLVLTGCTQADTDTVFQPVSQTSTEGPSSAGCHQPTNKQPARKQRRI